MNDSSPLLIHCQGNLDRSLVLLRQLVEMESYSRDKQGVDRLAGFLAGEFEKRGATSQIFSLSGCGNALKAVWRGSGTNLPVLVLGHLDTVWAPGTVVERPYIQKNGKAFGPGVFDMKSGILLCLMICEACQAKLLHPCGDVIFFFTPDEEIGSSAGLPLLQPIALACRAVLCLEPPLPGGKVKTFRKGVGQFQVTVSGVAAHAGVDLGKGANAIVELSRLVIRLQGMTQARRGVTLSVGTIRGGSAVNVVPAFAEAEVDFRFSKIEDGRHLDRRIRRLRPRDPRCRIEITGGINRPPLERTPAVADLFRRAKGIAASLGMVLEEGETGGGSDGSFTAALGIPTLDGLGVEGDGAHAAHEHVLVSDIPQRAAMVGLLAQELTG